MKRHGSKMKEFQTTGVTWSGEWQGGCFHPGLMGNERVAHRLKTDQDWPGLLAPTLKVLETEPQLEAVAEGDIFGFGSIVMDQIRSFRLCDITNKNPARHKRIIFFRPSCLRSGLQSLVHPKAARWVGPTSQCCKIGDQMIFRCKPEKQP